MFYEEIVHYMREFSRILKPTGRIWATFFVVNEGILGAIRDDPQTHYALSFRHPYGDGCYVNVLKEPRGAVAFDEETVNRMLESSGLVLCQPILWGIWSGQRADPKCGQDGLILMKPISSI